MQKDNGPVPTPVAVPVEEALVLDEKALDAESQSQRSSSAAPGLSEDEKRIIDLQIDAPTSTVGYFTLFRYATKAEVGIMLVSMLASVAAGACMPLMTVSGMRSEIVDVG